MVGALANLTKLVGNTKGIESQINLLVNQIEEQTVALNKAILPQMTPVQKNKCIVEFEQEVDKVFNNALRERSVSQHKNLIVRAWNGIKAAINSLSDNINLNIGKTGRQEKITGLQQEFKNKIKDLQGKTPLSESEETQHATISNP